MLHVRILTGPTASGKSSLALQWAGKNGGVIINADAMQLYDALPLLTAQPGPQDQALAPHRLYSVLSAHESATAQSWRDMVVDDIHRAFKQGQNPILVGGSGFYIKALLEGFSPLPDIPDHIRDEMNTKQKALGNPGFYAWLVLQDPLIADSLNPNDTQRLIRAAEVWAGTGQSIRYWQSLPKSGPPARFEFSLYAVMPSREQLHASINTRFDGMIKQGVLDEVEALSLRIDEGEIAADAPLVIAHGFRPLRHAIKGNMSMEDAVNQAKTETRQYAKRQTTWLRHQLDVTYVQSDHEIL